MRVVLVCVAALLFSLPVAAHELVVGKETRSYELFVPPHVKGPAPLVLVLHGRGGWGAQVRKNTGFDDVARDNGFVVAYPDGIDKRWADLRQLTLKPEARFGTDDVGFLLQLVDALVKQGIADPKRVYVAGHSNGGFMAATLACTHAEVFAGFAVVAASLPRPSAGAGVCKPARAIPGVFFWERNDPLIPFGGGGVGRGGERGWILSADDSFAAFTQAYGCTSTTKRATVDRVAYDGTVLDAEDGVGCKAPLTRYVSTGGGHGWPGRGGLLRATHEIDATTTIATFFGLIEPPPPRNPLGTGSNP